MYFTLEQFGPVRIGVEERSWLVLHFMRETCERFSRSRQLPLVLIWVGSPHVGLLRRGPRRREAECFLQVLSDAHGAEDVEEDEGTIRVVLPEQIPVRDSLNPGYWSEGEVGDNYTDCSFIFLYI